MAIYCGTNYTNPYRNLALEEYLLHLSEKNGYAVLFLWQNDNTVVIGRNQNAYSECNIDFAKKNGIKIARRMTGGGAVYHDMGNLNFTIILPKSIYDTKRSTRLIVEALKKIGVNNLEANGRNDICLDGRKISGNAYFVNSKVGMHHGTILYKVDAEKISNVLFVPKSKLSKHGVKSVKSRVCGVSDYYPDLSIHDIKAAIKESFCSEYNLDSLEEIFVKEHDYEELYKKYCSESWNINKIRDYEILASKSFDWGKIDLSLIYDGELLQGVEIATDALDIDFIDLFKSSLNDSIKTNKKICRSFFDNFAKEHPEQKEMIYDIMGIGNSISELTAPASDTVPVTDFS